MKQKVNTQGAGIGGAVALAILGSAGYDGLAAVQSASALTAIRQIYLVLPIPFLILIPVFYVFYKLENRPGTRRIPDSDPYLQKQQG